MAKPRDASDAGQSSPGSPLHSLCARYRNCTGLYLATGRQPVSFSNPPKRDNKANKDLFLNVSLTKSGSTTQVFGFFPGVLEGLGRSGRLIGTISTDPATY